MDVTIDRYIVDTLMRDLVGHDRRPAAYLVYLFVAAGSGDGRPALSHARIAEQTGLSKRAVQDALRHLEQRKLIAIERRGRTEPSTVRALTPWRR